MRFSTAENFRYQHFLLRTELNINLLDSSADFDGPCIDDKASGLALVNQ